MAEKNICSTRMGETVAVSLRDYRKIRHQNHTSKYLGTIIGTRTAAVCVATFLLDEFRQVFQLFLHICYFFCRKKQFGQIYSFIRDFFLFFLRKNENFYFQILTGEFFLFFLEKIKLFIFEFLLVIFFYFFLRKNETFYFQIFTAEFSLFFLKKMKLFIFEFLLVKMWRFLEKKENFDIRILLVNFFVFSWKKWKFLFSSFYWWKCDVFLRKNEIFYFQIFTGENVTFSWEKETLWCFCTFAFGLGFPLPKKRAIYYRSFHLIFERLWKLARENDCARMVSEWTFYINKFSYKIIAKDSIQKYSKSATPWVFDQTWRFLRLLSV